MRGMQTGTVSTRDTYWDVAKGLLMFLVILGHVIQLQLYSPKSGEGFWTDPLFMGIYLFHMPLFALFSGYFAAKSISKHSFSVIPRYLMRLALPCVGVGILYTCLSFQKEEIRIVQLIHNFGSLWYLVVTLECLFCYLLLQWKNSLWYKLLIFILPILIAQYLGHLTTFQHFWPYPGRFCYLWPAFVLGTTMAKLGFRHEYINWKWGIFLPLFVLLFIGFQPTWYVYRIPLINNIEEMGIAIYRLIAAIVGCGLFIFTTKLLHKHIQLPILQNIGKATLPLYVLQCIIFYFNSQLLEYLPITNYAAAIIASLLLMFGLYYFYLLSRRIPGISLLFYGEK